MEASAVPRLAPTGVTGVTSPHLLRLASDARLVVLVRQGWPAAFEAVYDRHHRGILSFCRHMLSDADEAEDAVQHTFLAAYNDLVTTDKPIHLRAWLFTIARNRCYSILRARREQPSADLAEPATEGLAAQVQRRQDLRDLVIDLRRLPDEQRAALVLAEVDALSHEQIGEALGVPREKVKALVFQARESLVASRAARETACVEIREQLVNGRGGALRRSNLRRHLRECAGCRDYRKLIERQRRELKVLIPVVPTLALKEAVLSGTVGAGAGAGGLGGGLLAASALKSGALKGALTLALAGVGTAGTYVAAEGLHVAGLGTPAVPPAQRTHLPPLVNRAPIAAPKADVHRATATSVSYVPAPAATGHVLAAAHHVTGLSNPFSMLARGHRGFPQHRPTVVGVKLRPSKPVVVTAPQPPVTAPSAGPVVEPVVVTRSPEPYLGESAYGTKHADGTGGVRGRSARVEPIAPAGDRHGSDRGAATTGHSKITSGGHDHPGGKAPGDAKGIGSGDGSARASGSGGTGTGSDGSIMTPGGDPTSGGGASTGGSGGDPSGTGGRVVDGQAATGVDASATTGGGSPSGAAGR
jgi:RNA polymerase sigma factor (sigma-70 family)